MAKSNENNNKHNSKIINHSGGSSDNRPQLQVEEEELESCITTNKTNLLAKTPPESGTDCGVDLGDPNRKGTAKRATMEWILGE